MTRFITSFLLLLVFFFGGVFFGVLQKEAILSEEARSHSIQEVVVVSEPEDIDKKDIEVFATETPPTKQKQHPIEKIAYFLEKTILYLYDRIIYLLFRIADFFFFI